MGKKKKRGGGGGPRVVYKRAKAAGPDLVSTLGPAALVLVGNRALVMVQKPEAGKEADDKTALLLAGAAYLLTRKSSTAKYAPLALVAAAMAHRRKLVLSGEMSSDTKDLIISEGAVAQDGGA